MVNIDVPATAGAPRLNIQLPSSCFQKYKAFDVAFHRSDLFTSQPVIPSYPGHMGGEKQPGYEAKPAISLKLQSYTVQTSD